MKPLKLAAFSAMLLVAINHSLAAIPAATVTQSFDQSTRSLSATATGAPAASGTVLGDGEYLKTGKTSLAEVLLANKTVTRLGPNTVFSYSATARQAKLQSGTILFSKPKDGQQLTIKMAGVSAAVTGTTGFVEKEGNNVVLGVVEGTVHVTVGTAHAILQAGKMLVASGLNAQVVSFDVPNFVKTSPFFSRFQGQLPNEKYVAHEIAAYNNLAARGFIAPVTPIPSAGNHSQAIAANQSAGHDAAGNPNATPAAAGASLAGDGGNIGASGGFTVSGATLNLNGGSNSSSLTLSGGSASGATLSGAGISKSGGGNLVLAGANSYTGVTAVNSGTLYATGNANYSGGTITTSSGTLAQGGLSAGSHGTTITGATGGTLTLGTGTISGVGTISLGGGTLLSSNGGATLTSSNGGVGTITINNAGGLNAGGTLQSGSTLVNNTNNPITVGGVTIPAHGTITVH